MSLFDIIKYPISDHPTIDELWDLPEHIQTKWQRRVGNGECLSSMINFAVSDPEDNVNLWHLREVIKDL